MPMTNNYYSQPSIPNNYNYQNFNQQQITNNQQVSQVPQFQNSILTVLINAEDEMMNYPVAAGCKVLLISFDENKFWLKGTEKNGVPEIIRSFEFNETTPVQKNQNDGNYATKDEISELNKKIDALIESLGGDK